MTVVEDLHPQGAATERAVHALGDDRITYLRNATNLGVGANTHHCFQLAEREFVLVTDYDDLLLPNYAVEAARLFSRYPEAAVVQPAVEVVDEHDQLHYPLADRVKTWLTPRGEPLLAGEGAVASLLLGNWLYCPALCYRRDAVAGVKLPSEADAVHDLARIVDVLRDGGSLAVGATAGYRYRRHRFSHSSDHARSGVRFELERRYFDAVAVELSAEGWPRAARAARRRAMSRFNALVQLPGAALSGQRSVAASLLRHVLR